MKKLYLLVLAAIATTASWADSRSAQQMLRIAQQKLGTNVTEAQTAVNGAKGATVDNQAYATFNAQNGKGFVIVGADDRLPEVLGYSNSGSLTAENMPPQLAAILQNLNTALPYMKGTYKAKTAKTYNRVDSLCTARWSQDYPYNMKCPKYVNPVDESDTLQCATGCVATALAQIIYYWGKQGKFPTSGIGGVKWHSVCDVSPKDSVSYDLSYDFSTPLEFDKMIDFYAAPDGTNIEYTTEQASAMAELMVACGAIGKMQYGSESNATTTILDKMEHHYNGFGKGAQLLVRNNYTDEEWKEIISGQIEKGYPVLYNGFTIYVSGGHAFVLDGITEDGLFHVNWGWGGIGNLYFDIDYLNPYAQYTGGHTQGVPYNFGNFALIDFAPNEQSQVSNYVANAFDFNVEKQSLVFDRFCTSSHARKGAKIAVLVKDMNTEKIDTVIVNKELTDSLIPDSVVVNPLDLTRGDTLVAMDFSKYADGKYQLGVITQDPEQEGWSIVRTPENINQTVIVTVSDGKVTAKESEDIHFDIEAHCSVQPGKVFRKNRTIPFTVKVSNKGRSICDNLAMVIIQNDDEMSRTLDETAEACGGKVPYISVTLASGKDTTFVMDETMSNKPGNYHAFVIATRTNQENISISDTLDFEVLDALVDSAKVEAYDENGLCDIGAYTNSPIDFRYETVSRIDCENLMFIRLFKSAEIDKDELDTLYRDTLYFNVAKGDKISWHYTFPANTLESGFYNFSFIVGIPGTLDMDSSTTEESRALIIMEPEDPTAIREVNNTVQEASPSTYDLFGRRVNSSTYRGIMIHNGKKRIVK